MRLWTVGFAVLAVLATASQSLGVVNVTAVVSADNHYGLFYGGADGTGLTFVGRNEIGPAGSSGLYNWTYPETWGFSLDSTQYLWVVAWDDVNTNSGGRSWGGVFSDTTSGSQLLDTNTRDWFSKLGGANPGDYGDVPAISEIQSYGAGGTWSAPAVAGPPGAGVRDYFPPDWIWHDAPWSTVSEGHYVLFRTVNPIGSYPSPSDGNGGAIPEPATLLVWAGLGAMGLVAAWRRRRRQAA